MFESVQVGSMSMSINRVGVVFLVGGGMGGRTVAGDLHRVVLGLVQVQYQFVQGFVAH